MYAQSQSNIVGMATQLWDGRSGVRNPVAARDFFFLFSKNVQTGSGAHPASNSMGTGVPSWR